MAGARRAGRCGRSAVVIAGRAGGCVARPRRRSRGVPRGTDLPLSFAQERLWFLDRLEPGFVGLQHPPAACGSAAPRQPALAGRSARWSAAMRRCAPPSGRSGAHPRQVIGEPFAVPMPRGRPPRPAGRNARDRGAALAARRARRRPFDLEHGPLLRALLVRVADDDWRALFDLHHIIGDGWSTDVLIREAGTSTSLRRREPVAAPRAAGPVRRLRGAGSASCFAGDALDGQLAYWRAQLAGAPPLLDLPADRPRPAVQRYRGPRSAGNFRRQS